MPQLFVVTDQKTVRAVATAVLTSRTSATRRAAAIAAIRAANPTLDLDRLTPGATLVIPTVPGLRRDREDPAGEPAEELLERARAGIAALAEGAERGEERRVADKKAAQELFSSATVKRLGQVEPGLAENVDALRAVFKEDDAVAKQQQADLRRAAEGWAADLEGLRDLL